MKYDKNQLRIDFINKANNVHDFKYDYSKVDYINCDVKVKIICPIHGDFFQKPHYHVQGNGCPKCGSISSISKRTKSQEDFIKQARKIHGDKYDYSKVNYKNATSPVEIVCPVHGSFSQRAADHLNGRGCPYCSNRSFPYTKKEWTEKATAIHSGKYNYKLVQYKNNKQKVKIICPAHGIFEQQALNHIQGQGCPQCSGIESPQELKIRKYLENNSIKFLHNTIVDSRYPWHVDIYIPERDLFIEYNGFWTHEKKWYNNKSTKDRSLRKKYEYQNAEWCPLAWWSSDVLKRQAAKDNNLNYVVLWEEKDIDKWFELSCPNGHDYDYEYSWITDEKERKQWLRAKKM